MKIPKDLSDFLQAMATDFPAIPGITLYGEDANLIVNREGRRRIQGGRSIYASDGFLSATVGASLWVTAQPKREFVDPD
jgi:hypothetical protein